MTDNIDLFVTNYNKNFTGVSATTANVLIKQTQIYNSRLVGYPLPDCPKPVSRTTAYSFAKVKPRNKPFSIWHVRRNNEMRDAIIARDILGLPIKIVFTSAAQRRHSLVPRWLISKMDTVIATTKLAASYVPNVGAIIPHGVNTEKFTPSNNLREAWKKTGYPGVKGIATIGRIRKEKGTDLFVDSMIRVLPNMKDLTALVIGKAGDKDKSFLENLKSKYYDEIKLRPGVTQDQQKATDFFNRYNKQQEQAEQQHAQFKESTKEHFNDNFEGFDIKVGEKSYKYNIQNRDKVAESQSNINNLVGKFLDSDGNVKDTKGYHKAMYAADNVDKIAAHFYEQGKADAVKEVVNSSKNLSSTKARSTQGDVFINGLKVKAISGADSKSLRIKTKKFN